MTIPCSPPPGRIQPANDDRRLYLTVDRSGGRAASDRRFITTIRADHRAVIRVVEASAPTGALHSWALFDVMGRWLAYRLVFRGGWTVHVDAPDRDPAKIRCRDLGRALETAVELARGGRA